MNDIQKMFGKKSGLLKFGFINNIKTLVDDINDLISDEYKFSNIRELNKIVDESDVELINKYGYTTDEQGKSILKQDIFYIKIKLKDIQTKNRKDLYCWFYKEKTNLKGVYFGELKDYKTFFRNNNMFRIGCFYFDDWSKGMDFLEDIALNTIPETWKYKNKPSNINHPILKSYIENIFERLKKEKEDGAEKKIIYSTDKKYIMFNTNLLDKYFHDVIIAAEVQISDEEETYLNPFRINSLTDRVKLKFDRSDKPIQPKFFENVNEVIYQSSWEIDKDFEKFQHIIDERRDRFPEQYRDESPDSLARKLDDAISFAVAIAKRNYKFIVPMYRPQTNSIQLLMPIYLNGTYSNRPDFALIITPNEENKLYIPETILPLDSVYQNARLIAKPDEAWLNPDIIL